jgi:hypothetical protein
MAAKRKASITESKGGKISGVNGIKAGRGRAAFQEKE